MKQGITITREYDHHDRPVVRITKRRGKLTLEEVSDLLRTEGWGEWNGYYAINQEVGGRVFYSRFQRATKAQIAAIFACC